MKILLDSCVWGKALEPLVKAGHDVLWVGHFAQDPGDEEILKQAYLEKRILVTLDKDFGKLCVLQGKSHCGIIRLLNVAAKDQAGFCLYLFSHYQKELEEGALITVDYTKVRLRLG